MVGDFLIVIGAILITVSLAITVLLTTDLLDKIADYINSDITLDEDISLEDDIPPVIPKEDEVPK